MDDKLSSGARCGVLMLGVLCGCGDSDENGDGRHTTGQPPVLSVDVSHPTADKPQSKLWYARGNWWAWLPTTTGSSIWQRADGGWRRVESLDTPLNGLTGRADVWADEQTVRAVLVATDRLTVAALRWDAAGRSYRLDAAPVSWPVESGGNVETATITRDGRGRWWVAYDWNRRMWVRCSLDPAAAEWSEPIAVSEPAGVDDIGTLVTLPGSIGLFWSDHVADAFLFRRHADGKSPEEWKEVEVVESGGGTANDHLNAALAADGTLFVAVKTGSDRVGRPDLMLYVRRPNGDWEHHAYGRRSASSERGRPIVLLSGDLRWLYLCHSVYTRWADGSRTSHVAFLRVERETLNLDLPEMELIAAALPVNNATGCKAPLPPAEVGGVVAPVVLASDAEGNIYEGRLDRRETPGD